MLKPYYFFVGILLLFACNAETGKKEIMVNNKDTALYWMDTLPHTVKCRPNYHLVESDTTNIRLGFFDTIPGPIANVNPVLRYTYDTSKLDDSRFIFLATGDYGIINNNGKHIYVEKAPYTSLSDANGVTQEVFKGNGYRITLTRKLIRQSNGMSEETGSLDIRNAGHQVVYKVHGGYMIL